MYLQLILLKLSTTEVSYSYFNERNEATAQTVEEKNNNMKVINLQLNIPLLASAAAILLGFYFT